MREENFNIEQSRIRIIEGKARENKQASLENILKQNQDLFFSQLDDLETIYKTALSTILDPASRDQLRSEKEKIRQYLLEIAEKGQNILAGKNTGTESIRQITLGLRSELERVRNIIPIYRNIDDAKSRLQRAGSRVAKVKDCLDPTKAKKLDSRNVHKLILDAQEALLIAQEPLDPIIPKNLPLQVQKMFNDVMGEIRTSQAITAEAFVKFVVNNEWMKDDPGFQKKGLILKEVSSSIPDDKVSRLMAMQTEIASDNPDVQVVTELGDITNLIIKTLGSLSLKLKFDLKDLPVEMVLFHQKLEFQISRLLEEIMKVKKYTETFKLSSDPRISRYIKIDNSGTITKTSEFNQLSKERQAEILSRFTDLEDKLALEIDEILASPEDRQLIAGKKKIEQGDIYGAKAELKAYLETHSGKPDVSSEKIEKARSLLQGIGISEVTQVQNYLQLMKKSINGRYDWGNFGAEQVYGALNKDQANAFIDGQEAVFIKVYEMIQQGEALTIEEARSKLMISAENLKPDLMPLLEMKAELEKKSFEEYGRQRKEEITELKASLAEITKTSVELLESPDTEAVANQKAKLTALIAKLEAATPQEYREMKLQGVESDIVNLRVRRGLVDMKYGFSIDGKRNANDFFNMFDIQARLSEPDAIKRKENLRIIAYQMNERGLPDLSRNLYDQYFADEKTAIEEEFENNGQGKEEYRNEFLDNPKNIENLEEQVKRWTELIQHETGIAVTSSQMEEARQKMIEQMVGEGYQKKINVAVNANATNGDEPWKQQWRKTYQGMVAIQDVGQTGTFENWFTSEEWNALPAKIGITTSIIIASGGIASGFVTAASVGFEAASGTAIMTLARTVSERFLSLAARRVLAAAGSTALEGTVFETVRGGLSGLIKNDWSMYSSPAAYAKAVGRGIMTFGLLKGVGAGFSRFRNFTREGSLLTEEAALAAYEQSITASLMARSTSEAAWWTGRTTAEGVALTGMSTGEMWLMGERTSAKDFAKGVGENFLFSAAIGGVHKFMGQGEHAQKGERGQSKEGIETADAIRRSLRLQLQIEGVEKQIEGTRYEKPGEVAELREKLSKLRAEALELNYEADQKVIAGKKAQVTDLDGQIRSLSVEIAAMKNRGENTAEKEALLTGRQLERRQLTGELAIESPAIASTYLDLVAGGSEKFDATKLLEMIKLNPELKKLFESGAGVGQTFVEDGVERPYTIEYHTKMVMAQYEKYFAQGIPAGSRKLPRSVDPNFMRIMLALHDIGKPNAIAKGDKNQQHQETVPIMREFLEKLGMPEERIKLATALVSADPIGKLIAGRITEAEAAGQIKEMARNAGMPDAEFLQVLESLYICDAGSYTVDAGGPRALDSLFKFDPEKGQVDFSARSRPIIEALRLSVNGIDYGKLNRTFTLARETGAEFRKQFGDYIDAEADRLMDDMHRRTPEIAISLESVEFHKNLLKQGKSIIRELNSLASQDSSLQRYQSKLEANIRNIESYLRSREPDLLGEYPDHYLSILEKMDPESAAHFRKFLAENNLTDFTRRAILKTINECTVISEKITAARADIGDVSNAEEFATITASPADRNLVRYLKGEISVGEYVRRLDGTEKSYLYTDLPGTGNRLFSLEKLVAYGRIKSRLSALEAENLPDAEKTQQKAILEQAMAMLREGKFGSEYTHGVNSLVFRGLRESGPFLLSSAELQRRGIKQETGEGGAVGGMEIADVISMGRGPDGFGTTRAYSEVSVSVLGYLSPKFIETDVLQARVASYREFLRKLDAGEAFEIRDFGVSREVIVRELSEYTEVLRSRERKNEKLPAKPYQVVFGFNDSLIGGGSMPNRDYAQALSGEYRFDLPSISLADHLEAVYVPYANMADARMRLESVMGADKASKIRIISLESMDFLGAGIRGGVYTQTREKTENLLRNHFDSRYQFIERLSQQN